MEFAAQAWTLLQDALLTATLLGLLGFILRSLFVNWITTKIDHNYKEKFLQLDNNLISKREEIQDLRRLVNSELLHRKELLIEKQIVACETIWMNVNANKKHALACGFLQSLKIEEMDKKISSGDITEFVNTLNQTTGVQKLVDDAADKKLEPPAELPASSSQPFISPKAWELYEAHSAVTWNAVLTLISWKNGMTTKILKTQEVIDMVKNALPHFEEYLEEYGIGGAYGLLKEIEEALLIEIKRFLREGDI